MCVPLARRVVVGIGTKAPVDAERRVGIWFAKRAECTRSDGAASSDRIRVLQGTNCLSFKLGHSAIRTARFE